jgi:hypothetical protein
MPGTIYTPWGWEVTLRFQPGTSGGLGCTHPPVQHCAVLNADGGGCLGTSEDCKEAAITEGYVAHPQVLQLRECKAHHVQAEVEVNWE